MQVGAGLHLNTDDVRAGFGEVLDVLLGLNNHQVHIQRLAGHRPQGLHDHRSNGDVGHKAAIHHIDVNPVSAGLVNRPHVLSKLGKVRGKDRRGNNQGFLGHGLNWWAGDCRRPFPGQWPQQH